VPQLRAGAGALTGTHAVDGIGNPVGRPRAIGRPIGPWAFAGVAVASLGGPLALAALFAPTTLGDASGSAGLATLAAVVVFMAPLGIWLRYSRKISSSGGLYAFVEAAAGRRVALAQAGVWIVSYLLYLIYTTLEIVYDLLPGIVPGERRYQTALALLIPISLAGVMIAGRSIALLVIGVIAAGQLALAGILDGVAIGHLSTPASTFAAGAPVGQLAKASAQTSLLYICGSLPLFLGGELARPARSIRRGLIAAYGLTAVVVLLAVAPLAAAPGLTQTAVPGVSLAEQFGGGGLAEAIGIGVAVSIAGVILCEYLALTRLVHAISSWGMRPVTITIGVVIVLAAPLTLIDPQGIYNTLLEPSLIALWLSQLIVFAVYPSFARKHRERLAPAWILAAVASALGLYGLWTAIQSATS
jgi:amino acid transporter